MLENLPVANKRCAIYTRKSTDLRLEQDLNSLTTQREICSAFIASQRHRGWIEMPEHYDDGGQSGVNFERPAINALMADIEAGKVDVVVIYKIDRLTRSLSDFIRLVEVFDRFGIPFVSVTQAFDTSDSVGRMILNILLTFSQFEREITAERIRDSIESRKSHGRWTGGVPPLGYKKGKLGLEIIEKEAAIVRFVYTEFLARGSYTAVKAAVRKAGLRSPPKKTPNNRPWGGVAISGANVYAMLHNPIYVGEIKGQDRTYAGIHEPIISREIWNAVRQLAKSRAKPTPDSKRTEHFLAGLLWDTLGRQMHLSIEQYVGRDYRYYVSSNANWSQRQFRKQYRCNAARLDKLVLASVETFFTDREKLRTALKSLGVYGPELELLSKRGENAARVLAATPNIDRRDLFFSLIERIEMGKQSLAITFRSIELRRFLLWSETVKYRGRPAEWDLSPARYVLEISVHTLSCARTPIVYIPTRVTNEAAKPKARLIALLKRARSAQQRLEEARDLTIAQLASEFRCRPSHFSRLVRLNYLAPDIVTAILDGTQPETLTYEQLFTAELPFDWTIQRRLLGFPPLLRPLKDDDRTPYESS